MKSKTCTLAGLIALFFLTTLNAQDFDVYVSDAAGFGTGPYFIFRYDQNGQNGTKFITTNLAWPQDIIFLEHENTVLVSNLSTNKITKYDADTGVYIEDFATGISQPTRMEIGPDSLLYVLQWSGNGKVKRYELDGIPVDDFTVTGVTQSIGITWKSDSLYVSSYSDGIVKRYGGTGADLGNFISENLNGPTNIWFGDSGDFFVLDWNDDQVKRFDSSGNFKEAIISGVDRCEGVDFYPNGDFAIGVGGASAVNVYKPDGTFVKNLVPAGAAGLQTPNAVRFRYKTTTSTKEVFKEITFVIPTVGTNFQISRPEELRDVVSLDVFDTTGKSVSKINLNNSTHWDASNLSNGIYYITAKLSDGMMARQKVVVQK